MADIRKKELYSTDGFREWIPLYGEISCPVTGADRMGAK